MTKMNETHKGKKVSVCHSVNHGNRVQANIQKRRAAIPEIHPHQGRGYVFFLRVGK